MSKSPPAIDYYEGGGRGEGGGATVIVVEYLESSMSRGLLCKFPDNSAFDFDYTQSSIWSPVVPRPYPTPRFDLDCGLARRLFCMGGSATTSPPNKATTFNRDGNSFKRKFNAAVYDKFQKKMKLNKKANAAIEFDYSQLSSSSQTPKGKGWNKLLKTASKQFKKKKKIKKREATNVQTYNSTYFTDWDF